MSGARQPAVGAVVAAVLLLGVVGAASCIDSAAVAAQVRSEHVSYQELRLPAPWGEARVLVTRARGRASTTTPTPIVIALHGAGEARRGPDRGFLGWVDDYRLPEAFGALARGQLRASDFGDLVRPPHLAGRNRALGARPFRDLLVVTPFTPNLMAEPAGSDAIRAYGDWLAGPLLDAVRRDVPGAARTRAGTGIDGVSLGGMLALEAGLRHPGTFATVGAIQPAIRGRVEAIAALADGTQRLRLLSSDEDPFLGPTRDLAAALALQHVPHELVVTPGEHGYAFNRGPGSIELLFFHERTLGAESD